MNDVFCRTYRSSVCVLLWSILIISMVGCGRKASLDAPPGESPPYPRPYPQPF